MFATSFKSVEPQDTHPLPWAWNKYKRFSTFTSTKAPQLSLHRTSRSLLSCTRGQHWTTVSPSTAFDVFFLTILSFLKNRILFYTLFLSYLFMHVYLHFCVIIKFLSSEEFSKRAQKCKKNIEAHIANAYGSAQHGSGHDGPLTANPEAMIHGEHEISGTRARWNRRLRRESFDEVLQSDWRLRRKVSHAATETSWKRARRSMRHCILQSKEENNN